MSKKRARIAAVIAATIVVLGMAVSSASARGFVASSVGAEPMIGEITLVAFEFAPRGYMDANGAVLPINENRALFSLYGTMYGGDGKSTFALPKMDPPLPGLKYVIATLGVYPQRP